MARLNGNTGKRLAAVEERLATKRRAVASNVEDTYSDAALAALLGGEISRARFWVVDALDQGPRRCLRDLTNAELVALIGDEEEDESADSFDLSDLSDEELETLLARHPPTEILRKLGNSPDLSCLTNAELLALIVADESAL